MLEVELVTRPAKIQSLEKSNLDLDKKASQMQKDKSELQAKIAPLEKEKATLTAKVSTLENEKKTLNKRIEEISAKAKNGNQEQLKKVQAELANVKKESLTARREKDEIGKSFKVLEKELRKNIKDVQPKKAQVNTVVSTLVEFRGFHRNENCLFPPIFHQVIGFS